MAKALFRSLFRTSSARKLSRVEPAHCLRYSLSQLYSARILGLKRFRTTRSVFRAEESTFGPSIEHSCLAPNQSRSLSHGTVSLVMRGGKAKFEINEVDPPRKQKWLSKKRLKMKRIRAKKMRKEANSKDPRRLNVKRKKKNQFSTPEERLLYKIDMAKVKEARLIKKLEQYVVPKVQGPIVEPVTLSGEEVHFLKRMAQKRSNYAPIGRRGVFGGVVLNMHMHWKRHETVKVICKKSCRPGQIHEFSEEIARLSGGIPIHFIGKDTVIFYRGKGYSRPEVMSPIDTLSKKKAMEKSKYEQSLDSVRQFIAICEKEIELYRRHIALYGGGPARKNRGTASDVQSRESKKGERIVCERDSFSSGPLDMDSDNEEMELSDAENDSVATSESDSEVDSHFRWDSDSDSENEESSSGTEESSSMMNRSSAFDNQRFH